MMDEKTYRKELVRMWDKHRNEERGTDDCHYIKCEDCTLYGIGCASPFNAFKVIEAIEKWSKEHKEEEE